MAAPVTPAQFKALIVNPNAENKCLSFNKVMLQLPLRLYQMMAFMFAAGADVLADGFRRMIHKPGTLEWSASSEIPDGAVVCNGAEYNIADYQELYDAIGTTWGTPSGAGKFKVPDLRDKFPVGAGSSYSLGQTGGEATVALSMENLPAALPPMASGVEKFIMSDGSGGTANTLASGGSSTKLADPEDVFDNLGSGTGHNNVPPYASLTCYIWT